MAWPSSGTPDSSCGIRARNCARTVGRASPLLGRLSPSHGLLLCAKHLFGAASRDAVSNAHAGGNRLCPGPRTPLLMVWKCTDGHTRRCGFALHSLTQRR
jgi:hypothetical protein